MQTSATSMHTPPFKSLLVQRKTCPTPRRHSHCSDQRRNWMNHSGSVKHASTTGRCQVIMVDSQMSQSRPNPPRVQPMQSTLLQLQLQPHRRATMSAFHLTTSWGVILHCCIFLASRTIVSPLASSKPLRSCCASHNNFVFACNAQFELQLSIF